MSKKSMCPLRSNSKEIIKCTSDCAWNVGSEVDPMCAIEKISLNLTSIDVNNGGTDF